MEMIATERRSMSNVEIAVKLINVMEPASVTDEAIKQAVLALLGEAEPKAEPKDKPKAKPSAETKRPKVDHGKICATYKAGWPIKEIAKEIGASEGTVRYHLQKEGLIK